MSGGFNFNNLTRQAMPFRMPDSESLPIEEGLPRNLSIAQHRIRMSTRQLENVQPGTSFDIDSAYEYQWTDIEEMVMDFDSENCKAETWANHLSKLEVAKKCPMRM
ncbi:uncharacterized protein LOC143174192 isoform X2 [Nomia melanderi]|uniref:uncharacterized protein LOC143174192 isoform X2 n=1 Tax=Nomia melanderi TaxID=2448451 RepID=UPI003FCCFA7F